MSPKPLLAKEAIARLLSGEDPRLRASFSNAEGVQLLERLLSPTPGVAPIERGDLPPDEAPSWVAALAKRMEEMGGFARAALATRAKASAALVAAFEEALRQAFFEPVPMHLGAPKQRVPYVRARVVGGEEKAQLIAEEVRISPLSRKDSLLTGKLRVATSAVAGRFADGGAAIVYLSPTGKSTAHLLDVIDLCRTAKKGDVLIDLSIRLPETQLAAPIENAHRGLFLELYPS